MYLLFATQILPCQLFRADWLKKWVGTKSAKKMKIGGRMFDFKIGGQKSWIL
jgi:hypothetical protein